MGICGSPNAKETKANLDYLRELLTDRTILASDPYVYIHLGKLLEQEILRIRSSLFSAYGIYTINESDLPDPEGPKVNLHKKVYMPTDPSNTFNFVGRILGPDGSTAKCLQQCLGVKIMIRGRGSMRDRKKEEANTGKPNWEHLNENLHVVLTVEDFENRAKARLAKASEYITLFLKESMKGSDKEDKVKQMQLMELSFRRVLEPRLSWHFNCNSLMDVTLPPKPGALIPNAVAAAANLLGFGYSYPPAPLFSPLHHNSHHHHHHFGAMGQPPAAAQQQQQVHQGASVLSGVGTNQSSHLAGLSHPLHPNLNTASMIMGHGLGASCYTSPYSPNGHAHASVPSTSSMSAGSLAIPQMNYWSGQGLSQLPPEYSLGQPHIMSQQANANGYGPLENGAMTLPNGAPCSQSTVSGNGQTVFLSRSGHEDSISHCLVPQLSACALDGAKELETRAASANGYHSSVHGSASNPNKLPGNVGVNNNSNIGTVGSLANSSKHGLKPRYSQKHATQATAPQGHPPNTEHASGRSQGRSTVVTVKVGANDRHSSKLGGAPANSHLSTGSTKELGKPEAKTEVKPVNGELNRRQNTVISSPTKSIPLRANSSEVDWPKLGSGVRDNSSTDITPV